MADAVVLRGSVGVLLAAIIGFGCTGLAAQAVDQTYRSRVASSPSALSSAPNACATDSYSCGPLDGAILERADAAERGFVSGSFSFAKPAPATQPPIPDLPLASFVGMNDFVPGGQHSDAEYVGRLMVDAECVYGIDVADDQGNPPSLDTSDRPPLVFISLPKAGTRRDPVSGAIWVWGYGPMNNGDLVAGGGGYTSSAPPECPLASEGQFYASTLQPGQE